MTQTFASAAEAERHADEARAKLASTLDQLKGNLTPRHLAQEAMAATRASTPDWVERVWETARSPSGLVLAGTALTSIAVTLVQQRRRR